MVKSKHFFIPYLSKNTSSSIKYFFDPATYYKVVLSNFSCNFFSNWRYSVYDDQKTLTQNLNMNDKRIFKLPK